MIGDPTGGPGEHSGSPWARLNGHIPDELPDDIAAAGGDLRAYIETLSLPETLASLACLTMSSARNASGVFPFAGQPPVYRLARAGAHHLALHLLLSRVGALTSTPPTHDHCQGFLDAYSLAEARIVRTVVPGGGRP